MPAQSPVGKGQYDSGDCCTAARSCVKGKKHRTHLHCGAGMNLEQARVLAELFSGKGGLLANPQPCNMAHLQAYYSR